MRKSDCQRVLAGIVTLADLVVFIHSVPIICEAWRTNRPLMVSMSAAVLISGELPANLRRTARPSLTEKTRSSLPVFQPQQFPAAIQGGDSDV
jgi:hypothetical protein